MPPRLPAGGRGSPADRAAGPPREPYLPPRSTWRPEWKPPCATGPLGTSAASARHALRTTVAHHTREDPHTVTLDHLGAVIKTAALPARRAAGGVSAGRWAAFHPLVRSHPGPLPGILDEVSAAHPDGITA
ncbi:hypothetical protein OG753_39090 [Streptomyces sp. NBC_00029]|uniref:hypothetical protein n=1 Tax=Streptomyces sp. NBC_00029 TaxID=2903613 RepID=UPI0032558650